MADVRLQHTIVQTITKQAETKQPITRQPNAIQHNTTQYSFKDKLQYLSIQRNIH